MARNYIRCCSDRNNFDGTPPVHQTGGDDQSRSLLGQTGQRKHGGGRSRYRHHRREPADTPGMHHTLRQDIFGRPRHCGARCAWLIHASARPLPQYIRFHGPETNSCREKGSEDGLPTEDSLLDGRFPFSTRSLYPYPHTVTKPYARCHAILYASKCRRILLVVRASLVVRGIVPVVAKQD